MGDWSGDATLGLTYGQVRLAPSDPGWPAAFQRLAAELRNALGDPSVAVEHVGSTAVPGLAAKPILDVVIGLAPDTNPGRVIAALAPLGYQFRGDKGQEGGLLLVLEDQPAHRVAHLHLVGHGDPQWRRYLALRDRLRTDPAARAAYAQLKERLAAQFSGDRRAYTAAKAAFITHLLADPHGSSSRAVAAARPSISGGTTPSSRNNPARAGAATTTVTSGPPRPATTDTDPSRTPATPESPADPAR